MKHDMQPFVEGCAAMKIDLSKSQLADFEAYLSLLLEWNQKMNLTAIRDPKEIMVQHFLDSISVLKLDIVRDGFNILDVGSGAGFPGIPIKIMCPEISLTLVDSVQKKTGFLSKVIERLKLENSKAVHARAEELARQSGMRETFEMVVSRAVAELRVLAEYCLPFVKLNGCFVAHKGPGAGEELEQAENALKILGGKWMETRLMNIPFSERIHNLVFIKKVNKTPKQYPRNVGKPKKSPL